MEYLSTRNKCNLKTTHQMPLDVILEILILLPAKSVLRFKCVCKEWYNLINNPLFAKLHLNKSLQSDSRHNHALLCETTLRIVDDLYRPSRWTKLNWPKQIKKIIDKAYTDVVGSCNGLVCFKIHVLNDGTATHFPYYTLSCFFICNPTTRTFKLILPSSDKIWSNHDLSYGFGYDSEHDDYKIVATSRVWMESDRDVRIFSLKADLWSYPTAPPTRVSSGRRWETQQKAIYRNKMLHYFASAWIVGGDGSYGVYKEYRIARFDVVTEKWIDDLSIPQLKNPVVYLREFDGRLYLRVRSYSTDVWLMEEHGSWKEMFHLPAAFLYHRLIACFKDDGSHRLLLQNLDYCHGEIKWYDPQDSTSLPFALKVPSSSVLFNYNGMGIVIYGVDKDYRIARFDVVTEKWIDDLNLPQLTSLVYLEELDGLLYLRGGSLSREIWMIEEDDSWKKMFHLPGKIFNNHRLIARSKDGRHRLLVQGR
ncbi:F-box/kelch-repeat protein At3g23880-like [Silene latifolia]|uniref:F-box/kelch-repeat protein At3g23880-like n=1 Tax=Silene latifolia TaxID=37657 RepID=UPI003D785013